ncbi:hypothetical protein [Micromonospora sp. RTGN7]|uniref:hypothetical protein n=1 Tax=Micromonospora sp. RTGN7 TaxID=3016526 RepID=UPI0039B6F081
MRGGAAPVEQPRSGEDEGAEADRRWAARCSQVVLTIYTAHDHQWLTRPGYVDAAQAAVSGPPVTSPQPSYEAFTSGAGEFLAWVFVPQ